MKRKFLCLLMIVLLLVTAIACKKTEEIPPAEPAPVPTPEASIVVVEQMPVHSDTWEDILAEEVPPPEEMPPLISSTTGREIDLERVFKPVFVCLDNDMNNRPLSGILEADVVYEAPAGEGGNGTRLLALFSDLSPAQVGPLGKADAAFADVQAEWEGLFIHEDDLMDGAKKYVFTPEDAKGDFVNLAELVPALYTEAPPVVSVRFLLSEGYVYEKASEAAKVRLPFGGGAGEKVEYAYDAETRMYLRYQAVAGGQVAAANALSPDEETGELKSVPLSVSSIIVQYVESAEGALTLTGSGKCDYFVGGVRVSGTWSRADRNAPTEYYLDDGSIVTLESGRTWIALHPADVSAEVF